MAKLQQERARDKSEIAKLKRQLAETKGPRKSYATAAANANAPKSNKPAYAPSVPAAGNPHASIALVTKTLTTYPTSNGKG